MKVGFVTCSDLSRYFVSQKNPLFTHDDQLAADFLSARGIHVEPVVWGTSLSFIQDQAVDLLIVRSPWDYMDTEANRVGFFDWLDELKAKRVPVVNSVSVLKWSLDKHYLQDLHAIQIATVTTQFLEAQASASVLHDALTRWGSFVVKPCIAAAAKDAFWIKDEAELNAFLPRFEKLRGDRAFMVQPFVREIATEGEWSLIFLNGAYSHAVLKLPKAGGWLVQDELGGSVRCGNPPDEVTTFAKDAYHKLIPYLRQRFGVDSDVLYARVDVMPRLSIGELELVEPELFFLDRRTNQPNQGALQKFYDGIRIRLGQP